MLIVRLAFQRYMLIIRLSFQGYMLIIRLSLSRLYVSSKVVFPVLNAND